MESVGRGGGHQHSKGAPRLLPQAKRNIHRASHRTTLIAAAQCRPTHPRTLTSLSLSAGYAWSG